MMKKLLLLIIIQIMIILFICLSITYLYQKMTIQPYYYLGIGILLFFLIGLSGGIIYGKKGFLIGLINGGIVCIILGSIILFYLDKNISITKFIIYILSASLGGSIGKNLRKTK